MAEDLASLMQRLFEEAGRPTHGKPGGWYSVHDDCVFFHNDDAISCADPVDRWLTLYRAGFEDHRVIGAQIRRVSRLVQGDLLRTMAKEGVAEIVTLLLAAFEQPVHPDVDVGVRRTRYLEAIRALGGRVEVRGLTHSA